VIISYGPSDAWPLQLCRCDRPFIAFTTLIVQNATQQLHRAVGDLAAGRGVAREVKAPDLGVAPYALGQTEHRLQHLRHRIGDTIRLHQAEQRVTVRIGGVD
jgi:hypothetical protein